MSKLKSRSAAIAIIICFTAEAVFSDALSLVFKTAGKMSPVCVIVGGGAAVLLMLCANNANKNGLIAAVVAAYAAVVLFRLAANTSYLYNGLLTPIVILGAAALAIISAMKGLRGAGIYCALCFVPIIFVFVICCIFGGVDFRFDFFTGFTDFGIKGFLIGSLTSFSIFSPIVLCAMILDAENLNTAVITGAISVAAVAVMMFIAIGVFGKTAANYPSVIAEMSKNVSFGKFFQRLEGFADASYIVSASAVITVLGALVGDDSSNKRIIRAAVSAAIFLVSGAIAYISIGVEAANKVMQIVSVVVGIAVIATIAVSFINKKHIKIAACMVLIMSLCGCTAYREIETKTFVVITAFEDDKIHFITESGKGGNMYTVGTENLKEAVKALENSKSISVSLLQAELILIGNGANIELSLSQSLESDMPNSAAIMLVDGSISEIYDSISGNYKSAFDFVSSVQENAERGRFACEPASAIKAEYDELGSVAIGVLNENGISGNALVVK